MKTSHLIVAALVMAASLSPGAAEPDNVTRAKAKVARGDTLLEQERYVEAESLFKEAIAVMRRLPSAHLGLGAALVGQQRYQEGLLALAEAEERYIDLYEESRRAEARAVDMVEGARDEVEHFVKAHDAFHRTPNRQGIDPSVIGRWNVDQIGGIPAQVFYLEGIALLRTGQTDQGIDRLQVCLALDEKHGLAHYNLAVALFGKGQPTESKLHLDAAVAAGIAPHPSFAADLEQSLAN